MNKIAPVLNEAILLRMRERNVPPDQRGDFLKWLRFYLDFWGVKGQAIRAEFCMKATQNEAM